MSTDPRAAFQRLVDIVARLRAPDGCPWDLEQTPQSAAPYLIEEAFEAAEAIDTRDPQAMKEELGDLLLQVVFQTQMIADTSAAFTIAEVANAVSDKLIRRHPHVFADTKVANSTEVLANWEQIKREEKPARQSMLDGLPKGLPALLAALRLSQKGARVGFDWPDVSGVPNKIREELAELEAAMAAASKDEIEHELGDLCFAVVQIARWYELDPEGALRGANRRFTQRFQWIEQATQAQGRALRDLSASEWDALWQQAKIATATGN